MKVRYPKIDFESVFPHWAPHLEFAHFNNASSITPCTLEPFMITVFNEAKKRLDPTKDAQLIREVDWFNAQEAQHYRAHARFNKCFETDRYPEMLGIEKAMKRDLDDFLANRSLEFCLAYSEGFESMGAVWYRMWFEDFGPYREGAKPEAIALFDWHYAEEFEHREVAFKLYMAVAARGGLWRRIFYGYFYRIWGARFAARHIASHTGRAREHLLAVDRAEMTPEEREASILRERTFGMFMGERMKKGMKGILSPFYDPAKKPPPKGLDAVLGQFDPGGAFARAATAA
ncbi:metal-dependent hydrolase [Sphingomonas bacterium]|uniref:metal-dependent hydrolase n=1 Tax=Sphingomonas bacterium TaxID=1895847 RepID=UPI001576C876|nr:metal-dependent hydrolase [Sphingomonas bacterium]